MKRITSIAALLFFISLFSIQTVAAQLVEVRIGVPAPRPRVVVVERPVCPSPDHVWVEGHWVYDNYSRQDVWIPGQWVYAPPPPPRRYDCDDHHRGRGRDHAPGQKKKKYKHYDD
jgi:WXXGXW repeat (2 copies)